ncbi:MAG: acetylxylan esterase [Bacteroidaceae bacterium]|nr:acetylxylan esterase [Bacteroidaceae bacterium]
MKLKSIFAAFLALASLTVSAETTTTLWSGSTALGNWEGFVYIEAPTFSAVETGDVLEVTISELDEAAAWHQVVLKTASEGWPSLPGCDIDLISATGVYRKTVTDEIAAELKATGLVVGGCYLTVSSVTLISDVEPSTIIWTPEEPINFGEEWSKWATIPHSAFANAKVGDLFRLNIQDVGAGAQGHISYIAADWSAWLDVPDATEYKQLSGAYFQYTITEQMLPILKGEGGLNGIVVTGYRYTLVSAELIDPSTIIVPAVTVDHTLAGLVFEDAVPTLRLDYAYAGEVPAKTMFKVIVKQDNGAKVGEKTMEPETNHVEIPLFEDEPQAGIYNYELYANGEFVESLNFAVNPLEIAAADDSRDDFSSFWETAKAQLKGIAIDATLTKMDNLSTAARTVYLVEMKSVPDGLDGEPVIIRGYYAEPNAAGTYPAIIHYQGYDSDGTAKPYELTGDSNPDYVEFVLSTRGQSINNRPPYVNPYGDWFAFGFDDKNHYYYRGAYMDAVRAIDFVASREKVQTNNIFAEGQSQGGALTIAAAALSEGRLNSIAPAIQFMGHFPQYFQVAAWPASVAFKQRDAYGMTDAEMYDMLSYFDTKNLAKWVTCPVKSAVGLQDNVCPIRTNLAPYNNFGANTRAGFEKELTINPTLMHQTHDNWYNDCMIFFKSHTQSVTMINEVGEGENESTPVYYDLVGHQVAATSLVRGIYIEVRGTKANKILVK